MSNELHINNSNIIFCYKCKKNKAKIQTRDKTCINCFLQLVDYIFKNTLREKCLFKNKTTGNLIRRNEKNNEKNIKAIENFYEEKNKKKVLDNTALTFSGDIFSCFLLYSFIKYLKNYKNTNFFLKNEHAIFNTIIYVDIYEDDKYVNDMLKIIEELFENIDDISKDGKKNKEKEKNIMNEKQNNTYEINNHTIHNNYNCLDSGYTKKKINNVDFVILKSNYFINKNYKETFKKFYNIIKKEKTDYLYYINEIIIYNNIIKYCLNENINYVLFGNSANNISKKTFLHTVLGNGINVPLKTSYIINIFNKIKFIKPLKDLLNKEIYLYCFYKNINYLYKNEKTNNLLESIEEIINGLDAKNNTTFVINNTINNLITSFFNSSDIYKNNIDKNDKKEYNEIANFNDINDTNILHESHFNKNSIPLNSFTNELNNFSFYCYICLGIKETEKDKFVIKKLNKNQKENLRKMKYTSFICSTCLTIFSSNPHYVNLYNIFYV